MIIYKITNIVNNKIYIGITTKSLNCRWKQHKHSVNMKCKKNKHLYSSMKKYGINNFKIEIIEKVDNLQNLFDKEKYYIKLYDTNNPKIGYNKSKTTTVSASESTIQQDPSFKL